MSTGVVGIIITVCFGLSTIYFYLKSRTFKQLSFIYKYSVFQATDHPLVSVTFDGREVKNVSSLLITIFNSGTKEIRKDDFPNGQMPIIQLKDSRILHYRIVRTSSNSIGVSVDESGNSKLIASLNYLNPSQGAVVEILYENLNPDSRVPIEVKAPLIGGRSTSLELYMYRPPIVMVAMMVVTALTFLALGAFIIYENVSEGFNLIGTGVSILITIVPCFGILYVIMHEYKKVSKQVPKFARDLFKDLSYPKLSDA